MTPDTIGALTLIAVAVILCIPSALRHLDRLAQANIDRMVGEALAEEEAAWESHKSNVPGLDETPIYSATAEHAVANLDDEWAQMNGEAR